MLFFLSQEIEYKTELKCEDILTRIQNIVAPIGHRIGKPYEGELRGTNFKMTRILSWINTFSFRNGLKPIIYGTVNSDNDKTTINVKMRLNSFIAVFVYVWLASAPLAFIYNLVIAIRSMNFETFLRVPILPIGILLFAYFLIILPFKTECKKSKEELQELFNVEIKN